MRRIKATETIWPKGLVLAGRPAQPAQSASLPAHLLLARATEPRPDAQFDSEASGASLPARDAPPPAGRRRSWVCNGQSNSLTDRQLRLMRNFQHRPTSLLAGSKTASQLRGALAGPAARNPHLPYFLRMGLPAADSTLDIHTVENVCERNQSRLVHSVAGGIDGDGRAK